MGISVRVGAMIETLEHVYPHGHVRIYAHICRISDGEPRDLEVSEHKWVNLQDIRTIAFPPANDRITAKIIDLLRSRRSWDGLGFG